MESRYIYHSPFAAPRGPEPEPEVAGAPPPVAAAPRPGLLARLAAAMVVLVLAAGAAGAVISHAVWPGAQQTITVAGPGSSGTSTFQPGGSSGGSGSFGGASTGSSTGSTSADAIGARVSPALVDINVEFSYQGAAGAGTGIVVSSNGRVVTNNHVISGATRIRATDIGNGKTYDATVVGYDPSEDIAVLQLQGASGLQTAKIGHSSSVSVGDDVVGVGNAGGVGGPPTSAGGKVTALNQSITATDGPGSSEQLSGLIRTSANIEPGDSGGALADTGGRVIGMNTAGSTGFRFRFGSGTGVTAAYAIPIDRVMATASQVASGKGSATVHVGGTAFLGVTIAAGSFGGFFGGGATTGSGVTVGSVLDGKPAAQAGLSAGDTITSIGGTAVDSPEALSSFMLGHHPGDKVQLAWTDALGGSHSAAVTLTAGPPA